MRDIAVIVFLCLNAIMTRFQLFLLSVIVIFNTLYLLLFSRHAESRTLQRRMVWWWMRYVRVDGSAGSSSFLFALRASVLQKYFHRELIIV